MITTELAYCSSCHQRNLHVLRAKNLLTRDLYQCVRCNSHTFKCRIVGCTHMARGAMTPARLEGKEETPFFKWDDVLCAEHDGSIYSFERLGRRIVDIDEFDQLFQRDTVNVGRALKYAGGAALGATVVAGVVVTAGTSAPLAAWLGGMGLLGTASTGTAIASLSGAALTSASLAAIGGSMATGTAIITATGAALGGVRGGLIAGSYHAEDPSFAIRRVQSVGSEVRTVFINGFLQQDETTFQDWASQQLAFDPNQNLYGVNWASKSLKELGKAFVSGVGSKSMRELLIDIGKAGNKKVGAGPAGWLAFLSSFADNPWHVAMFRAARAGVQLADAIARTDGKRYTLVGHSLGCRVIFYALAALATKKQKFIANVVLLGGAVGRDDAAAWGRVASAVEGTILNCYSSQDGVLNRLYRASNAWLSDPIGIGPIVGDHPNIVNIDCSNLVDGHTSWKPRYAQVIERIRQSVKSLPS